MGSGGFLRLAAHEQIGFNQYPFAAEPFAGNVQQLQQPLHRSVNQRRVILLRLHKGDRRKWFRIGCLHQKFLRQQMLTQAEHPRLAFFKEGKVGESGFLCHLDGGI